MTHLTLLARFAAPSLLAALLAGCGHSEPAAQASEANFAHALNAYLAKRGDLCLDRSSWPVDVTRAEFTQGSRNATQLPVLEKLGLVASTEVVVDVAASDGHPSERTQARRYRLTDAGRGYYLAREPHQRATGRPQADHDLCAARLTLRRVLAWEPATTHAVGAETVVSYTYNIAPAAWTNDPEARRAFPMVERMVRGEGVVRLKEGMVLTSQGWQAKDL
ncbi:MAG: hypothetical protein JWQ76_475 [Ramlibacter sp.]|nr:hypothetical protein [Ramlibacter sp.]